MSVRGCCGEDLVWMLVAALVAHRNSGHSAFSEALEATIASAESSAETQLIEKEWLESFRDAVSRLSERQRHCLELRAQGLRYRDIAEVLEIRISTARNFCGGQSKS